MGKDTGFKEYDRQTPEVRKVDDRVKDYSELYKPFSEKEINEQSARCMDCGVPFCHSGCPLGNRIPEFNDAVYQQKWEEALEILLDTNNFPEFTGRICPAPCEGSCVLGINKPPVTIELIEKSIIERAFDKGWMKPQMPVKRTDKLVAVIGSGPAGLACAEQLNKAGHRVTVYERANAIGGLLRLGIPDFKLSKGVLDRRLDLMTQAGIEFITNTNVGVDISCAELEERYDAVVLCGGSTVPRDMDIPGREFKGIHFAMDFLSQQNNRVGKRPALSNHAGVKLEADIMATNKHVVVIGGGDTGSD
jgi:glutamate synthase (NADPH/NADH) small chain